MDSEVKEQNQRVRKRDRFKRFVDRNRMELSITLSVILQLLVLFFWYIPPLELNNLDRLVEEVAFVDSVIIQEPVTETQPDDGEFEPSDKLKEEKKEEKKEDPRISGAQDAIISGATAPVDLSPNIKPEYTTEARAAGITGTMTLEIIIADTGEVLRVRSVGKNLGYGLEEAAIKAFKKKQYSPSILDGKAINVKVLVPVRWTLD
ncbi:MAG: energy transducer TonB [Leptospiraceae bacterium]|nr:energy transducer TonB [Leptospiraceae bacterium]MCP5497537.1 energy transducer TonB [Leptospiraceae bacterium]